jgi:signal transduction histidine kinase
LFQPFRQADSPAQVWRHWLSLAIVKQLAEMMDGSVGVKTTR